MSLEGLMNLNKIFCLILCLCICASLVATVDAEKICDYEYESGNSRLFVSNRNAEKCVALTFDDGPHPKYTPIILDILDKYNAKATFFVIGTNAEKYPEIIRRESESGHEIGNHTYSHPDLKKINASDFMDEITRTNGIIEKITGKKPRLFRPPGGYLNNIIVEKVSAQNGISVLWSWRQDTKDWACPSSDCIVTGVLSNLRDGDVILFHDYNANSSPTPEALERILKKLSSQGYKFVTVSELMGM